ncbi:MAG: hypothetical protein ACRC2H_09200, partial [Silanimonas sp.]
MTALPRSQPTPTARTAPPARTLALGGLALLVLAQAACAHPRPNAPADARWVRLEVVDRDLGTTLPQYRHRREAWVAGEDGQPYTLRLTNLSGARVLVVLSVDGVNVVTGESANPAQSGYVLAPYASAEIDGWRKSMHEVAAFRFSAAGDSYAARTGRPFDLGVIGAAVFREAVVHEPWPTPIAEPLAQAERDRSQDASRAERRASQAAPAAEARSDAYAGAPVPTSPLGTGHGERRWSPTSRTAFERASRHADEIIALRYDRREALVARGVIRAERQPWL